MKIIEKPIDSLIPYEFNNKTHSSKQIDHIANSIKEFWFTQPIVIDKNNVVIIGHWRLEGAKKLWMENVPVVIMEDLSETQIKKLRILDNKLNESEWNVENLKMELEDLPDLNIWDLELEPEDLFMDILGDEKEEEKSFMDWDKYTMKVDTPIYTPLWLDISISDMINCDKQKELEERIKNSDLSEEIKDFLIKCSYRFIEYNYKNIAEFYAKSSLDIQNFMEDLALVVIDYNKAIEDWYTALKSFLDDIAEQDEE